MLAVVPASMAANSYNLLLFSSLDLSFLFFYNAINFSFSSSFATSATIATTAASATATVAVAVAAAATTIATTSTFQPPSVNFSLFFSSFSSSLYHVFISFYYLWPSG